MQGLDLHCCACSRVCYHTNPPTFCIQHAKNNQQFDNGRLIPINTNDVIISELQEIKTLLKQLIEKV